MKQLTLFSIALSLGLITSCKKKKEDPQTIPPIPVVATQNFVPLKVGNYWIYNVYSIQPSGQETFTQVDSVYISGDSIVNNTSYFILENAAATSPPSSILLRQQNSDIMIPNGTYYYKNNDFTTVFYDHFFMSSGPATSDTMYREIRKMADNHLQVTVPAGTYSTITYQYLYKIWPTYKQCCDTLYWNRRFAENVGVVQETTAMFLSGLHMERRLVRYHLN